MNTYQSNKWINLRNVTALIMGIGLVYGITTVIIGNRLEAIEKNILAIISEQETVLVAIAEVTARNGADAVTESVIHDCNIQERSQFDSLLGRLDKGLTQSELIQLERLFGRCGSFYAERKALMVARLSREIDVYEDYVRHLGIIVGQDVYGDYLVSQWQALATEERKQSELFVRLVQLQDEIIQALIQGSKVNSPEIIDILHQVREVQETLVVANKQATNIRSGLVSF